MSTSTHDTQYINFLQKSFGTTTVPFFGGIICVVTLVIIIILILLNSTMTFTNKYITVGIPQDGVVLPKLDKPIVI